MLSTGVLAICTAGFVFGLTDVLLKKLQSAVAALPLIAARSGISAAGLLLLWWCSDSLPATFNRIVNKPARVDWALLPYALLLCSISYFGLYFFMRALRHVQVSQTVGFNKIGVVIGVTVGILVFNEPFGARKLMCCALVLAGVAILERRHFLNTSGRLSKGLAAIIAARLCWSVGYLFQPCIQGMGVLLFSAILEGVVCLLSLLLHGAASGRSIFCGWRLGVVWKPLLLLSLLGMAGEVCSNMARQQLPVALLAFLGLVAPATTLLFARLYLGEQMQKAQWLGVGFGLFGALLYAL